ncbi:MAG: hypothetical protein U0992_12020 [Planctomycetaceae bacterium]
MAEQPSIKQRFVRLAVMVETSVVVLLPVWYVLSSPLSVSAGRDRSLTFTVEASVPIGRAIPLKYRHDYIEDAVLVFSCGECSVFLIQDAKVESPTYVELVFQRAKCVRSARTDCTPAIGIYPDQVGSSFIVELTESQWPIEAHKAYVYATSPLKPSGRHFVVSNHDVFHEILAESFSEGIIGPGDSRYGFVTQLFNIQKHRASQQHKAPCTTLRPPDRRMPAAPCSRRRFLSASALLSAAASLWPRLDIRTTPGRRQTRAHRR